MRSSGEINARGGGAPQPGSGLLWDARLAVRRRWILAWTLGLGLVGLLISLLAPFGDAPSRDAGRHLDLVSAAPTGAADSLRTPVIVPSVVSDDGDERQRVASSIQLVVQEGMIAGVVVDADHGTRIAGAMIRVQAGATSELVWLGSTLVDGSFAFSAPDESMFPLAVSVGERASMLHDRMVTIDDVGSLLEIRLSGRPKVRFRVESAGTGEAISGAEVYQIVRGCRADREPILLGVTDADGNFGALGDPSIGGTLMCMASGYGAAEIALPLGVVDDLVVELAPGICVEGSVVGSGPIALDNLEALVVVGVDRSRDWGPLPGRRVEPPSWIEYGFVHFRWRLPVDSSGHFAFESIPGEGARRKISVRIVEDGTTVGRLDDYPLDGRESTLPAIILGSGEARQGVAVINGEAAGGMLRVRCGDTLRTFRVSRSGAFEMDGVGPGEYGIVFAPTEFPGLEIQSRISVVDHAVGALRLEFDVEEIEVFGRVVPQTDHELEGLRLLLAPAQAPLSTYEAEVWADGQFSVSVPVGLGAACTLIAFSGDEVLGRMPFEVSNQPVEWHMD